MSGIVPPSVEEQNVRSPFGKHLLSVERKEPTLAASKQDELQQEATITIVKVNKSRRPILLLLLVIVGIVLVYITERAPGKAIHEYISFWIGIASALMTIIAMWKLIRGNKSKVYAASRM